MSKKCSWLACAETSAALCIQEGLIQVLHTHAFGNLRLDAVLKLLQSSLGDAPTLLADNEVLAVQQADFGPWIHDVSYPCVFVSEGALSKPASHPFPSMQLLPWRANAATVAGHQINSRHKTQMSAPG